MVRSAAAEPVCGWKLERAARRRGALLVAGLDEVGRGPMFGPVVAAAVIFPKGCNLPGLTDSKKLTEKARNEFDREIRSSAVAWAIAAVDVETIDRINIRNASLLAMRLAVEQLALTPDYLLIDGVDTIDWPCRQQAVVQGDSISLSIAAASVLAKVHRDRLLIELDSQYPGYGLARHKGYCSAEHLKALALLGPTPLHRKSFSPVAQTVLQFDDEAALEAAVETLAIETVEIEGPESVHLTEVAPSEPRFACPCCGYLTLLQQPPGTFAHCEVCWWEDDPAQFADPDYEGCANAPSLNQARAYFREIGVSDPNLKGHERAPRREEMPLEKV
ncbi:MAG TPA: ribonuclease HII [Terracidiphilus sp.]|nr:ribonuclease HII [Terracidiphilus sp.]